MRVTVEAPRVLNSQSHCLWTPGRSGVNQRTCVTPTVLCSWWIPSLGLAQPHGFWSQRSVRAQESAASALLDQLYAHFSPWSHWLALHSLVLRIQIIDSLWETCTFEKKNTTAHLVNYRKKSWFMLFILPAEQAGYLPVYSLTNKSIPSFLLSSHLSLALGLGQRGMEWITSSLSPFVWPFSPSIWFEPNSYEINLGWVKGFFRMMFLLNF